MRGCGGGSPGGQWPQIRDGCAALCWRGRSPPREGRVLRNYRQILACGTLVPDQSRKGIIAETVNVTSRRRQSIEKSATGVMQLREVACWVGNALEVRGCVDRKA